MEAGKGRAINEPRKKLSAAEPLRSGRRPQSSSQTNRPGWDNGPAKGRYLFRGEEAQRRKLVTAPSGAIIAMKVRELQSHVGIAAFGHDERNSESRMRENRPSGLMRGGKHVVIGLRDFQSTASRLLYTPIS